jgi:hypothetical protein
LALAGKTISIFTLIVGNGLDGAFQGLDFAFVPTVFLVGVICSLYLFSNLFSKDFC